MLDINMLRPHVLEGLASGQLKLLELVDLVQDSVREELTHLSTPTEVSSCSRTVHQPQPQPHLDLPHL